MINVLTVIDTIRALTNLITNIYPHYDVIDYDIDEGFVRPCFFIEVEELNTSWVASDYLKESSNLKIVFFAEDRYEGFIDLLDMKNNLTTAFNEPLLVENEHLQYYITLTNTDSDLYKQDKVLTFNIQADLIQKVERKEVTPYMENLETNIN